LFFVGAVGFTVLFAGVILKTYLEKIRLNKVYVDRYLEKKWSKKRK